MIMNKTQIARRDAIITELESIEAGGLHGQLPIVWEKAKQAYVWDIFGNRFIDFTSTIFVTNCGHGAIAEAISTQAKKLIHSYTFPTVEKLKFLRAFKAFLPEYCERIFLASAGSEVTSWAINLMRAYKGKRIIVHIDGAFHGKTGSAGDMTNEEIKISFPTDAIQYQDDWLCLESNLKDIAGIMIESYQGWSGRFMDRAYIQRLVRWANQNDIPVCFDEIQGGFYRCESKFAYEWYRVEPDLVCMGKGLGGGFPLSALAGRAKYFNVPGLSSTHSGNPLACAAGLAALKVYQKIAKLNLGKKSCLFDEKMQYLATKFDSIIDSYTAHGLLGALIFKNKDAANKVCDLCTQKGLLVVKTGRESIKLGPPLVINEIDLIKGFSILEQALHEVVNG